MSRRKKHKTSSAPMDMNHIVRDVTAMQLASQHIPALVAQEVRKAWKQLPNVDPKQGPKSWFHDPLSLQYSLGYKDRRFSLTYDTLRRVAGQLSIISAIINTRAAQVAAFAQPYRWTKSLGFTIRHKDSDRQTTPAEVEFIKELEQFILNCGRSERNPFSRVPRDDFEMFLRKMVRDSLTLDQCCAEIVPDKVGLPYEFYALDASTVRIAADDRYVGINSSYQNRTGFVPDMPSRFLGLWEGRKYGEENGEKPISFVQVINGQIENVYSRDELMFGVRNPRTDIWIQGYGYSELEQLITIVTSHLYAEEYNRRFFCMCAESLVNTKNGMIPIVDLVDKEFEVWNGKAWRRATAFETGKRNVRRTKLWNGLELRTSPDHKFHVIPRDSLDGSVEWRTQDALKTDDYVLVNYTRTDCPLNLEALLVGKTYQNTQGKPWTVTEETVKDVEFWEMIGFALGDGLWPTFSDGRSSMMIYPHHTKDAKLFEKFLKICDRHGINAKQKQINLHVTRVSDGETGYPSIAIFHTTFSEWLRELGFRPSNQSRQIPRFLFSQPAWMREAVLRGLFSADGHRPAHKSGYNTPTVFSACPSFQADIVSCLWSVGVSANLVGKGWNRNGSIDIQDIDKFVEHIGYLQDYKNENIKRAPESKHRWDKLHPVYCVSLARKIKDSPNWDRLSRKDRDLVCKVARNQCQISRPRAISICANLGIDGGDALKYVHAPVDVLDHKSYGTEMMYDVEVFDDEHIFLANHMAVHNSAGSSAKGILNLKGDNFTPEMLEGFRRQWLAQVSGVESSWKTPVLQSEGLEYIDLNKTNQEMEFGKWMEYLLKVAAGVYLIDPQEIGFNMQGSTQHSPMFESSQEWKIKASRDRGLKPLLRFLAKMINTNIIDKIDDHFTLEFVGLDELSENEKHEMLVEQISSYMTLNEGRRTLGLNDLPGGDIPMNPVYQQALQLQAQQGMGQVSGAAPPEQTSNLPPGPGGESGVKPSSPRYSGLFGHDDSGEN